VALEKSYRKSEKTQKGKFPKPGNLLLESFCGFRRFWQNQPKSADRCQSGPELEYGAAADERSTKNLLPVT
jgi:hypothetical protein